MKKRVNSLFAKCMQINLQQSFLEIKLDKTRNKIQQLWSEADEDETKRKEFYRHIDLTQTREQLKKRLTELEYFQEMLVSEINALEYDFHNVDSLIDGSIKIVAATVTQAYLKFGQDANYDAVVVDEVSMLSLSAALVAGMAKCQVVLAGDPRQFAAINKSKDPIVVHWMDKSVFDAMDISESLEQDRLPSNCVFLKLQYRNTEYLSCL
nr:hypothetical protein [Desulfobulbaceae bacterium]